MNNPAFNTVISGAWGIWAAALATLLVLAFLIAPVFVWWVNRDMYLDMDDKLGYYFLPYLFGLGAWVAVLVVTFLVCLVIDLWIGVLA